MSERGFLKRVAFKKGGGMQTPALIEGRDAFEAGLDDDMNPYDEESLNYDEWLCGYIDAAELEKS